MWINEKQMEDDSVSEANICDKAKQLMEELGAKAPSTSTILFLYLSYFYFNIFSCLNGCVGW